MPWSKPYSLCRGLRHYRCMSRSDLVVWVDKKLRSDWSPEQIAGCPRLDYPEDAGMRISERPSTVGFMQPHSLAIPTIAIYAAPQTPEAARPGRRPVSRAYRYSPAAAACCRQIPLWGVAADPACAARGKAAHRPHRRPRNRSSYQTPAEVLNPALTGTLASCIIGWAVLQAQRRSSTSKTGTALSWPIPPAP